jgi:hypothetical protein
MPGGSGRNRIHTRAHSRSVLVCSPGTKDGRRRLRPIRRAISRDRSAAERPFVEPRVAATAHALGTVPCGPVALHAGDHLGLYQPRLSLFAVPSSARTSARRAVGSLDVRVTTLPKTRLARLRRRRGLDGFRWPGGSDGFRRLRPQRPGAAVVLSLRYRFEVSRCDAVSYAAQVVDVQSIRDCALPRLVGQPVRADGSSAEAQATVTALPVDVTGPDPAPIGLNDAGLEEPIMGGVHAP